MKAKSMHKYVLVISLCAVAAFISGCHGFSANR